MKTLPSTLSMVIMQTRLKEADRERQQILFPTPTGRKKVLFDDNIIEFPK